MNKKILFLEFLILYFLAPILFILFFQGFPLIPFIMGIGVVGFIILYFDSTFSFKHTFSLSHIKNSDKRVTLFIVSIIIAALGFYRFQEEQILFLVREFSYFTILLPIFYTLFSVIPQTLFYRTLFFHRYAQLFQIKHIQIIISALVFSIAHIVLFNLEAVIITFVGGLIFSYYYEKDKSILGSVIEHGAYGSVLFLLGFGVFLYSGAQV